ncbi:hypothetical protein [Gilliamella sp. ESL0254]|uniref:hypothetical protein n=1 Tax=Gilliamella sp. ESL0254 TaxID=2705035 RepID=UPI0015805C51|nr:hypothetical protein [Gilliamella sp. ESL0254]NUF27351.1 hypothetical protein [Gilliamella sp. ESL0254]
MYGIWHLACQTYALNLFHFHRSRNQTQFSFLSSSSLSSLTSSTKLSLRPRFLLRSCLVFAPLLLLSYSQGSQALSAYTSKVIEGSAPYLTFDGGRTKLATTDMLLAIRLPDGRIITSSTNTSSVTNPIKLINGSRLSDIGMIIPPSVTSVSLDDLVHRYYFWDDDDGDGVGADGVTATGSLSVSFTDKNGNTVSRNDILDICRAPYKVKLSSTGGSLITQYGVPNSSNFGGNSVEYYINPNSTAAMICYARPNLAQNSGAPADIWNSDKGFLVQSTNPSSYGLNFPTTGSDGLYFDLDIGGVDGSQLRWSSVSRGGITATVNWTRPRSDTFTDPTGVNRPSDSWISDKSQYVTRVTLNGPRANDSQINSSSFSLSVPSLPQTFELEGRDSSGRVVVKYGFQLKQWFVNRRDKRDLPSNQSSWCSSSSGYRLAKLKDLTNAYCNGCPSATPSSPSNNYQRRIGAGFFAEWGAMYGYADAGFANYFYWTPDFAAAGRLFAANADTGTVLYATAGGLYAVCTTP